MSVRHADNTSYLTTNKLEIIPTVPLDMSVLKHLAINPR